MEENSSENKTALRSDSIEPTANHRAEDALKKLESQHQTILQSAMDGFLLVSRQGRILEVNDAYCTMSGYTSGELLTMSIQDLETRETGVDTIAHIKKVCAQGNDRFISKHRHKNGTILDVEVNAQFDSAAGLIVAFLRDITALKQAEAEILRKTALLEAQLNCTLDGIIIVNPEGKKVVQNQRTVDLWKIPRHIADNPDDSAQVQHVMHLTKNPEQFVERIMYLYNHPDETTQDIVELTDGTILERYSAPVLGEKGQNFGRIWTFHDITASHRVEEELRKSEALMRTALENLPLIFYMIDSGGIFRLSIGAGLKGLGLEQNQVVGLSAFDVYKDFPEITDSLNAALTGKTANFESTIAGSSYFNTCVPFSTPSKEFSGLIAVALEITELKKAEDALKQSEYRFRRAIENAPFPIMLHAENGEVLALSEGWTHESGYSMEDIPTTMSWSERAYDDTKKQIVQEEIDALYGLEQRKDEGEYTIICKDGTCKTWDFSSAPLGKLLDGRRAVISMAKDVTDRKRIEEELQKTQKLESLGILAGGIAHDFNNLMGGIFGYIDMAKEISKDTKVSRYLAKAMNTIERARGLTQQLLTFAKGGTPIRKIERLVPFLQETAQFALSGSHVACRFSIQEDLWTCNFDRNQIGQVIDNIVINAQQAMPLGGEIKVAASNITFTGNEHPILAAGDYVKLSVNDSGIGIPGDLLTRIFDPFFTTKAKGHGLGLATSFSIIKRHGGAIEVESEPAKGSTFHVFLPAASDGVSSSTAQTGSEHNGWGVFLVMDDEEVMRETMSVMLEMAGYTVIQTENGQEAIDFFKAETNAGRKVAGMIFDLTVPGGVGGKEAISEIRSLSATIPVFVASGYAEDPVMSNPEEYGFTASICKPFTKSDLFTLLNRHLRQPVK